LIDRSFGMVGVVPLRIYRSWTKQLKTLQCKKGIIEYSIGIDGTYKL